jgi:transposase
MDDARLLRGAEIVKRGGVAKLRRMLWQVRSQSHAGAYLVDVSGSRSICTCLDFETRGSAPDFMCKHAYATAIRRRVIVVPGHLMPDRKPTYGQDWPAYNRGQEMERERAADLLAELCGGIGNPLQTTGRPRHALANVVFAMVSKVYGGLSTRRSASEIRAARTAGFIDQAPSSAVIFRAFEDPKLTPLLRELVHETALPLAEIETVFAVDSTGFSTCNYERWFDVKYGRDRTQQRYVKLHAIIGTLTHVITDAVVDESGGDAPRLPELVQTTSKDFKIEAVVADKAYLSKRNVVAITDVGGIPYIPFKAGTSGAKGPKVWKKMYAAFTFKNDDFMAAYHARSNVETVFSMVKRKFGGSLRSKLLVAQTNEILCKCIAHNLSVLVAAIYEIGLAPHFWQAGAAETTSAPSS